MLERLTAEQKAAIEKYSMTPKQSSAIHSAERKLGRRLRDDEIEREKDRVRVAALSELIGRYLSPRNNKRR